MLEVLLLVAAALGAAWGAVVVHETGHFVAGLSLGVPARSMSVRLENPPHLALRYNDGWVSPDDPQYASAFGQHNPSPVAAWLLIAGGFLVETVVAIGAAAAFQNVGGISLVVLAPSTVIFVLYIAVDAILSKRRKVSYGDFFSMFALYPVITVAVVTVVLCLRVAALLLLIDL